MIVKMKFIRYSLVVIAASLVVVCSFQNCGQPSSLQYNNQDLSSQADLSSNATQILKTNCYSCHNPGNAQGGITDITDVEFLIYSRLVVAGEPGLSLLISQISQGLMPPSPNPGLAGADVETLKAWITGLNPTDPGTPPVVTPIQPTYSSIASQVFTPICISCHQGKNPTLDTYASVMQVVKGGDAANSILYQAITTGLTGGVMPQGGSLTIDQINAIKTWINNGAMNN